VELTRESSIWVVPLNSCSVFKRTGEVFIFEYETEKVSKNFPSSKVFDFKKLTVGSVAIGHDQYGKVSFVCSFLLMSLSFHLLVKRPRVCRLSNLRGKTPFLGGPKMVFSLFFFYEFFYLKVKKTISGNKK
jgi:hypothetical protein